MGRKKRSSQNSNNVITNEDSSESESSKESTQGSEGNFRNIDLARSINLWVYTNFFFKLERL